MGCRRLEDLENVSEMQVDEKIIPAVKDLDVPLVMGSRLKKLIKSIQEAAKVSWKRKRKGTVEEENVPLPSEELKRSGSLFFSRYKLRSPQMKTQEEQWLDVLIASSTSTASGSRTSWRRRPGREKLLKQESSAQSVV